jgi:hypothetical protein
MARKHYGKPFNEYKVPSKTPSKPKPSKPKPSKPTASKPAKATKPAKQPNKKPSPKILGTGLAQRAGSKISKHQKKTKERIDKMFN